jgi:hypothetical protein
MDGDDDEEGFVDEEALQRQKLLELLNNDDQGMAIEYLSGEEAEVAKQNGKAGASNSNANNGGEDEDEDDLMGDDY